MYVSKNLLLKRRRRVINMGGKNLGQKYWGTKILGKYSFRQHYKKNPLLFSKISEDIFLVIDNFFQKFTPLIKNVLPFLCMFLSLSLFLLSFMFLRVKNKTFFNYRLIIGGGAKKEFCLHLNYWGACPPMCVSPHAVG